MEMRAGKEVCVRVGALTSVDIRLKCDASRSSNDRFGMNRSPCDFCTFGLPLGLRLPLAFQALFGVPRLSGVLVKRGDPPAVPAQHKDIYTRE